MVPTGKLERGFILVRCVAGARLEIAQSCECQCKVLMYQQNGGSNSSWEKLEETVTDIFTIISAPQVQPS